MNNHGWICPRCETVHAPSVLKCECAPKAATPLDVLKRAIDSMPIPVYVPGYIPYPYPYPYTLTVGDSCVDKIVIG